MNSRRDFLKYLGVSSFVVAVNNVDRVTNKLYLPSHDGVFVASHWTIDRETGDIRYIGPVAAEPVPIIDLHRWLQDQADRFCASGIILIWNFQD